MISVTKNPPAVVLSNSEILVAAQETDIYDVMGSYTKAMAVFSSAAPGFDTGDRVTIAWGTTSILFTCVASNPSESQFINSLGSSVQSNGLNFVEALKKTPEILNAFKIAYIYSGGVFYIYLTPYEITPDFNLSFTITQPASGNVDFTNGICVENDYRDNLKIAFQLFYSREPVSGLTNIEKYYDAVLVPVIIENNLAKTTYDISRLLEKEQTGHFTFPETGYYDAGGSFAPRKLIEKFKLYVYSQYGSPPEDNAGIFTTDFAVVYGDISEQKKQLLNAAGQSWWDDMVENKRFNTYAPLTKTTDVYCPEKLSWTARTDGTLFLFIKEYYLDGTNSTFNFFSVTAKQYDDFEFVVSFAIIKSSSTQIVKYEAWLQNDSAEIVSEVRTYIMDYNNPKYARYFIYKNRLNAYETIRLTGYAVKNNDVPKSVIKLLKNEGNTYLNKSYKQIVGDRIFSISINSGYFPEEWVNYLSSEFIGTDDAYRIRLNKIQRIYIQGSKTKVSDDKDDLHYFNVDEFVDDLTEEFYTNYDQLQGVEPPVDGDFNFDFNEDFFGGE